MLESIKLTEAECAAYDNEDHATWEATRREFQRRAVALLAGRGGTVEMVHIDGTVLDWIKVAPAD